MTTTTPIFPDHTGYGHYWLSVDGKYDIWHDPDDNGRPFKLIIASDMSRWVSVEEIHGQSRTRYEEPSCSWAAAYTACMPIITAAYHLL